MHIDQQQFDTNRADDEVLLVPDALADSTVVIVDDDMFTIDVIRAFLSDAGYRNFIAISNPAEAMEGIRQARADAVLLDLMMPGISGFDILQEMRADEELCYTPVIMLTSAGDADTKLQALEFGATDFLAKPVDPSELTLRLRNTLAFRAYSNRLQRFDNLTGLPNRPYFIERLDTRLQQRNAGAGKIALLHLDLDRFKQINDTLGYNLGDVLLKAVSSRLRSVVTRAERTLAIDLRDQLMLARFGSDEFVLMIEDIGDGTIVEHVATNLLGALSDPIRIGKHELFITASIGIAAGPSDGDDAITLIKHAEIAMQSAKEHGQSYRYYSSDMNALSSERLMLQNDLRFAIQRDELFLVYQPQVEIATGQIVGVEALLRWRHRNLGMIMPGKFISIAEETGLINELGEWALMEACRQTKEWEEAGVAGITMSVNVAAKQFRRKSFVNSVQNALEKTRLAPEKLILEVTESMLLAQIDKTVELMQEIKSLGVSLSIDDFGTGYSSLSYLRTLPIDEIKIDRSFVTDIVDNPQSAAIVKTIITLAEGLGLKLVVEGVETEAQLHHLGENSCQHYQGYFFSRPLPPAELFDKLVAFQRPVMPQALGHARRAQSI